MPAIGTCRQEIELRRPIVYEQAQQSASDAQYEPANKAVRDRRLQPNFTERRRHLYENPAIERQVLAEQQTRHAAGDSADGSER